MSQNLYNQTLESPPTEFEISLRPPVFSEFIGQEKVTERLLLMVEAARQRGDVLQHVLLSGPPGLGKTTLANLIATAVGTKLHTTSGPQIEKAGDLAGILTNLGKGDLLFIDEIHRLHPTIEEYLYPAMEDYRLDIIIDQGPNARSLTINLPRFTLVGATTRAGMLTAPLRSRFGMVNRLDYYSTEELARIVLRSAALLDCPIEDAGATELAARSRGTPRIANALLRWVRDFAQVRADGVITAVVADQALTMIEIDKDGIDESDRRLLEALVYKFDGGPVGLNSLAVAIGDDATTLEEVNEPYLILRGFLKRTPRGRVAMPAAYLKLGLKTPAPGKANSVWSDGSLASLREIGGNRNGNFSRGRPLAAAREYRAEARAVRRHLVMAETANENPSRAVHPRPDHRLVGSGFRRACRGEHGHAFGRAALAEPCLVLGVVPACRQTGGNRVLRVPCAQRVLETGPVAASGPLAFRRADDLAGVVEHDAVAEIGFLPNQSGHGAETGMVFQAGRMVEHQPAAIADIGNQLVHPRRQHGIFHPVVIPVHHNHGISAEVGRKRHLLVRRGGGRRGGDHFDRERPGLLQQFHQLRRGGLPGMVALPVQEHQFDRGGGHGGNQQATGQQTENQGLHGRQDGTARRRAPPANSRWRFHPPRASLSCSSRCRVSGYFRMASSESRQISAPMTKVTIPRFQMAWGVCVTALPSFGTW